LERSRARSKAARIKFSTSSVDLGQLLSILSGHSALRYEIEMSATPGLSRECRFGKSGKLFQAFVTMKLAGLSFALSI